jgi:hypothetical protein
MAPKMQSRKLFMNEDLAAAITLAPLGDPSYLRAPLKQRVRSSAPHFCVSDPDNMEC